MAAEPQRQERVPPAAEPQARSGFAGAASDAADATGNIATTVIRGAETVVEELLHAAGRVTNAAVDEIFYLAGNVANGISDTAGALFGRRMPTRTREPHETR